MYRTFANQIRTGMIYPKNYEQKIGFDTIRLLLKEKCLSSLGKQRIDEMKFSSQFDEINEQLDQTVEMMRILQEEEPFPHQFFIDVRPCLKRIRAEGTYLDEPKLFDLRRSLETIRNIIGFLTPNRSGAALYPALYRLIEDEVLAFPQLIDEIDRLVNPFGHIRDDASDILQTVRSDLTRIVGSISHTLNHILKQAQSAGYVDREAVPTLRDGRLVIPVAPTLKRKIKGIVHDESSSGKTVFIEPEEVVEANNRIRELEHEEKREIVRILMEFSVNIRPQIPEILRSYEFLAEIDFIRAKALFAIQTNGLKPDVEDACILDWGTAVHPLLQMSLAKHDKEVVPLDIELNSRQRILLISGPNAGGKSVCLKTVGLLQYMLQCGMPVPLSESSKAGIFRDIFIDIGDEQSIEDDLSTYSSHLSNMKTMLKHGNEHSLILIDEFGGGTEPQIGGAIAEALLKRFNEKKIFGLITTHYQNLKHYAEDHEGIVNGAMLYDRHLMQALFQLQIGNPGSSFAVEIARKIGLPEDVIDDASALVGSEYINSDKYLQDIVRDKRYWENKRQHVRLREKYLEEIITKYEAEIRELDKSRKEIIRKAKEEAEWLLKESNARIEKTIRTIKEAQAEKEQTKQVRQQLEKLQSEIDSVEQIAADDQIEQQMRKLQERQARRKARKGARSIDEPEKENLPLREGDTVRITGQSSVGQVAEINGNNAVVIFGVVKTTVNIARLERANRPPTTERSTAKSAFVGTQTQEQVYEKKLNFKQDIDVRGMRGDEAIRAVTYFIDDAVLLGAKRVRILHGTGSGILRMLIRKYLSTVPGIACYRDEHVQLGGVGITVVDLL